MDKKRVVQKKTRGQNATMMESSNTLGHRLPRFLIIRAGAVGDSLLLLPLLQSLRQYSPMAHIAVMGYPARLRLLLAYANTIASIESAGMETFFVEQARLAPALIQYFSQFDLILSYRHDPAGVFTQNLRRTEAKRVVSMPPFPSGREQMHIIDHYLQPLVDLQIPIVSRALFLPLSAPQRAQASTFFHQQPLLRDAHLVVAMHPGSGGAHKRWPATHFAALADRLTMSQGATILFITGPADHPVGQEVCAAMQTNRIVIAAGLELDHVAALLAQATLYIGNDSGITHLAAAVGTPTIAILGATDPQRWAPRGRHVHVLTSPSLLSPAQTLWDHFPVDRVEAALVALLQEHHGVCNRREGI
jgi:ADP-heptose:LPS heptosyltransferase